MFCDYRELARSLDARLPVANVVRRDWLDQAQPWLSTNTPAGVIWTMPSHLGSWDRPAEFNTRLRTFLVDLR